MTCFQRGKRVSQHDRLPILGTSGVAGSVLPSWFSNNISMMVGFVILRVPQAYIRNHFDGQLGD